MDARRSSGLQESRQGQADLRTYAHGMKGVVAALLTVIALLLAPVQENAAAPGIQHWKTANGARVYFVPAMDLPMVDVQVVFDAGSARDGKRPGIAKLTNGLLAEGAGELDADGIAERFERLGARFSTASLRDMATVSLRSLSEPAMLEQALETVALILHKPTFPEQALERERKRLLISLRQQQQSPSKVAKKDFYREVFVNHPYASWPDGSTEGVQALTREDIRSFYEQHYVARNTVVAIVGALTRKGAEQLARKVIGGLPRGAVAPPIAAAPAIEAARTRRIEHPSVQTHILVGQPGMHRGDPDYFPLYVGNHTLGGSGLVSRINEEIREKRGLSYSAYSYFLPMRADGPFIMGLQTRNDQADEALKVLHEVLERFVKEGPSEDELQASKKNITGGFPLRIDSNRKITDYIAMIGFYDLPLDYLDTFNARVMAVTRKDIRDAFQRRVHPGEMVTVIVGGGVNSGAGSRQAEGSPGQPEPDAAQGGS